MNSRLLLVLISIIAVSSIHTMEKLEKKSETSASQPVISCQGSANRGLRRSNSTPAQEETRKIYGTSYKYVKSPIPRLSEDR